MKKNNNSKQSIHAITVTKRFFRNFGIKSEVNIFLENLSALLDSGMGIQDSLVSVAEDLDSKRLFKIINKIKEDVVSGTRLHKALKNADILQPHTLSLIRLGEDSGKLSDNLKVVILQNEKESIFKSRIRSSLLYSTIVVTLAITVGVGSAWFTLPKLATFFEQSNAELPLITQLLIKLGGVLNQYGVIIVPMFIFFVLLIFYFLFSFPKTKFIGHSVLFRLPVIKSLITNVEISRFSFFLGTMLKAGVPVYEALISLPETTTFTNYKKFYEFLEVNVVEGNSFSTCFELYPKSHKLFPGSVKRMITTGEQSGKLSEILLRMSKTFEQKVEVTAKNLPILLEPILLIIIGIMVAVLALGTIMPIYNLIEVI